MALRINCLKCRHYFTSWDKDRPRGCKVFNFKTPSFPSEVIKRETGEDCHYFEERKKAKEGLDFRDPKNW